MSQSRKTSRTAAKHPSGTRAATRPARAHAPDSRTNAEEGALNTATSAGYDANAGPLDTGFAGTATSLVSEAEAEILAEPGLSLDPGDLGPRALEEATQEDFANGEEKREPTESLGLAETRIDATDDDDADGNVDADAEDEDEDEDEDDDEDDDENEDAISPSEPSEVDLTQNTIDEGSLFDQPRNEGGTRHPAIKADDVAATLERNARADKARKHHT